MKTTASKSPSSFMPSGMPRKLHNHSGSVMQMNEVMSSDVHEVLNEPLAAIDGQNLNELSQVSSLERLNNEPSGGRNGNNRKVLATEM